MAKSRLPPKKDVALALLESSTVYVHLDPRADGVSVPPWFKKQPQLVLQIGLNMPVPIPDLSLDGEGVSCTLSFNRTPQFCNVPWKAVYALVGEDGRGMVWPDDVPPEVATQTRTAGPDGKPKRKKKAHLRAVAEGPAAGAEPTVGSAEPTVEETTAAMAEGEPSQTAPAQAPETAMDGENRASDSGDELAPASKRKLPPYLRVVK